MDVHNGRLTWLLRMIDPSAHCGEVHVSFAGAPQGDLLAAQVSNKAMIFLDTE